MKPTDASLNLADYYLPMLDTLSQKAKLYLVKKLTESLWGSASIPAATDAADQDEAFRRLAGTWADDPEAEAMTEAVHQARTTHQTRQLIPFDE